MSLSLVYVYFVGLAIFLLTTLAYASLQEASGVILEEAAGVLGLVAGVVVFFLPLRSIHRAMLSQKAKEQTEVRAELARLLGPGASSSARDPSFQDLWRLQLLEARDKRVAGIHTWPFDTGIIGRFTAILISVVTTIVGRMLILYILGI